MLKKDLLGTNTRYNNEGKVVLTRTRYKLYSDSGYYIRKIGTTIKLKQVFCSDVSLDKYEETDELIETSEV